MAWNVVDARWDEGMTQLFMFQREHGHCCVPTKYVTPNGNHLGKVRELNGYLNGYRPTSRAPPSAGPALLLCFL